MCTSIPTYTFPNGTPGISSLYIMQLTAALSKIDPSVTAKRHDNVLRDIRESWTQYHASMRVTDDSPNLSRRPDIDITPLNKHHVSLPHSYVDVANVTYLDDRGKEQPLLMMSPDLALNVAAKYSIIIRARVIDDLNALKAQCAAYDPNWTDAPPILSDYYRDLL